MSIANNVLQHLQKVKSTGQNKWISCCPAHDDRSPSLAIKECDNGNLLIHCFSGCDVSSIVGAIGLELSDLFPENQEGFKQEYQPFPAADILKCLLYEARIIHLAASDIVNQIKISSDDLKRIELAYQRISEAVSYAKR